MLEAILTNRRSRHIFAVTTIALTLLLIGARYAILPRFDSSIKTGPAVFLSTLSDGILISLIVTVAIALFAHVMTPDIVRKARIEVIDARDLPNRFKAAFLTTESWWYKGGCGRYLRTKTLPEMAKGARSESLSREVRIVILDPELSKLCRTHAEFRRSTASAERDVSWSEQRVRNELYATIVVVQITRVNEPRLRITLNLATHYSAFRIDLSDTGAIITKEDRNAPAIVCEPGTYYYKSYKEEIILAETQCREIKKAEIGIHTVERLTAQDVRSILKQSDLSAPDLSCADLQHIADICKNGKNPYG